MEKFVIGNHEVSMRLDKVMSMRYPDQSRVFWQKKLASGTILVNGEPGSVDYRTKAGDRIEIRVTAVDDPAPKAVASISIPVIFENQDVLVINKPAGLVTHPSHGQTGISVAEWAGDYHAGIRQAVYDPSNPTSVMRAGIVHRLDKNTSGVMVLAKTTAAMTGLAKQIQAHTVTKIYRSLLFGYVAQSPLAVHTFLNRSAADRRKIAVVDASVGRESETIFTIMHQLRSNKGDTATYVEARPITGRTHQIRVHASHIGHPILGDTVYGSPESNQLSARLGLKRQWLHAYSLTIRIPHETKPQTFVAELPHDLQNALTPWHTR